MSQTWERITELFGAARSLDANLRSVFLDIACGGDAALRTEVERLLADDARMDGFLAPGDEAGDVATPLASLLQAGDVVKERYRVESRVASGGQAFVYRAADTVLSRPVILKVMRASGRQNRLLKQRFEDEMRALARIDHPSVVGILDVGELPDGCPFLVIQYVEGVSLREELQQGPLDRGRTAALLRQLGSALSSAHAAGVAHQDLKPENIMLQRLADGSEALKLIDFGISKIDRRSLDSGLTSIMVAGTIRYMAPEQFQGENSAACDVYALALVTCEMLSGHPDARAITHVSRGTRRLIESALAFLPADRPDDVRRWSEHVAGTLEENRVRRRQLLAGAAGLILTAGAATVPMRWLSRGGGEPRRIFEKVGAFDPLTEGFEVHNEVRGTVAFNTERNGYDGWRAITERQGHYFKRLTDEEKRLALDRGWTLTAVMRLEEGSCFALIDFSGVGKRFDIDLHRHGDDDIVRLYTQIVPAFQGIDFPLPRLANAYHTYELRYDAGLEMADLWIDGVKRLTGYRGHSQFQGDGDLIFGVGTYESPRGVASFQQCASRYTLDS